MSKRGDKWIAYVGPFSFPDGGAASRRILGISKALQRSGYRVVVASGQMGTTENISEIEDEISVVSLNERTAEHLPVWLKRLSYVGMGEKTKRWLENQSHMPTAVIVYSGYTPYLKKLIPFCKRKKIPILFDAVEWYQLDGVVKNLISPYQINIEIAMRYFIPKMDGVIVISKYLEYYYKNKGCKTIKIPPTLDIDSIGARLNCEMGRPMKIAYTGVPATKDSLNTIIEGVHRSIVDGLNVELHIAGPSKDEILNYAFFRKFGYKNIPSFIVCHGKLSHDKAIDIVRQSDFSILLRPINRVSNAGFSTKFVESVSVGTPPIVNLTGDLADFVDDMKNAIVVNKCDSENIFLAIRNAAKLSDPQYSVMRYEARLMAISYFNNDLYSNELNYFIEGMVCPLCHDSCPLS